MLIFISSAVITSIISFCFLKKNFWENRYIVLLIIACAAFIATLTTNYMVRGKLSTRTEIIWKKNIYPFYINDSSFFKKDSVDIKYLNKSVLCTKKILAVVDSFVNKNTTFLFIKNWRFLDNKYKTDDFLFKKKDSTHLILTYYIFYTYKKDTIIGYFNDKSNRNNYYFNDIYISQSESDTLAYILYKKMCYDTKSSSWLTGFSFPRISSIKIIYLPPKEYKLIPKQFLRKIPY